MRPLRAASRTRRPGAAGQNRLTAHHCVWQRIDRSNGRNINITNNHVHDSNLGQHEGITLNGNVDGFQISINRLTNLNNIGIDIVGGETTSSNRTLDAAISLPRRVMSLLTPVTMLPTGGLSRDEPL